MDAWDDVRRLNAVADAALRAAMVALGTARFVDRLAEYHHAMSLASRARQQARANGTLAIVPREAQRSAGGGSRSS
jgi:hypothetical protein